MFFDYWRDYTEDEARARLEHEKETISREAWVQKESALQDERDQFFQELQAFRVGIWSSIWVFFSMFWQRKCRKKQPWT